MNEPAAAESFAGSGEIDLRSISGSGGSSVMTRALLWLGLFFLVLVVLAEVMIRRERWHRLDDVRDRLEAVAVLKSSLLERWVSERGADVAVSARGVSQTMRALWSADPAAPEARALVSRAEYLRAAYDYESVEILDRAGKIVLSAPPRPRGEPVDLELPANADVARPRFHWTSGRAGASPWTFVIAQPLTDGSSESVMGWLVLTMDPRTFLQPLLADWPGPDGSAETILFAALDGAPTWLRSRSGTGAADAAEIAPFVARALRREEGSFDVRDGAGVEQLAYARPVAGTPWVLATKIEQVEALAPVVANARMLRLAPAAIVLAAAALGWSVLSRSKRRLEERAARANQRFEALFAQADEAVFLLDERTRVVEANPSARALFRIRGNLEKGVPFADFLSAEDLERLPLRLKELAERGTLHTERRLQRADGETFPAVIHDIQLPQGRILTIVRDLSEQWRADERERRAKRMASFGTWDWDPRSDEVHWDDETFLVLGLDPAHDRPTRDAFLERVHPDDRERVQQALRLALADEEIFDVEFRVVRPDGRERAVRSTADVLRNEAGTAIRVDGALQDITARRVAESQLAAARAQVAEAQRTEAVVRLASGIAHDFNNVVGVIAGFAELAELELEPTHPTRAHVAEIRRATNRAAELTRRLLATSRNEPPGLQSFSLCALIEDSREVLREAMGPGMELELDVQRGLGTVRVDPARVVTVLQSLAANARDAMPEGGRFTLRTRRVDFTPEEAATRPLVRPGSWVALEVEDTGSGMDRATLERCFEPYFTTKAPGAGTGLGLSAVKRALEEMGGTIEVESEPGRGTRFTLWFPCESGAAPSPAAASPAPVGHGERVLVVDDVAQMREIAGNILVRAGFWTSLAQDAESALERLTMSDEPFDLLLTDVVMPRLSGRELAERALAVRPDLRVLFMTGHAGLESDGRPFELPETSVIEKPFAGRELVRRVRSALDAPVAGR